MYKKLFGIILLLVRYSVQILYVQSISAKITLYESKKYDEAYGQFGTIQKNHHHYTESRYYMGLISIQKNQQPKAED